MTAEVAGRQVRPEARFVAQLKALHARKDRAALSALRRSLGKAVGESPEAHRYVVPWLPANVPEWRADLWYLVAALFATYPDSPPIDEPDPKGGRSFGRSAGQVRATRAQSDAVDRRFTALLAAHAEDVAVHLRHFVRLCRDAGAGIDWAGLLMDLQAWRLDEAPVQRRWARAYWSSVPTLDATDVVTLTASSEGDADHDA